MRREPILANEVRQDDLIIAKDLTRLRVSSTLEITNRDTVIIYGRSARGDVGIPHGTQEAVVRLA